MDKLDFIKSEGIFDTVKPFYYVSKIFGFTIFRIVDKKCPRLNILDFLTVLIMPVFFAYYQISDTIHFKEKVLGKSSTLDFGIKFVLVLEVIMIITGVIINALKRGEIFNLLVKIDEIDKKVSILNTSTPTHFSINSLLFLSFHPPPPCQCHPVIGFRTNSIVLPAACKNRK